MGWGGALLLCHLVAIKDISLMDTFVVISVLPPSTGVTVNAWHLLCLYSQCTCCAVTNCGKSPRAAAGEVRGCQRKLGQMNFTDIAFWLDVCTGQI